MAITIVVGNFKSGVGKSKVSVMASWELALERKKKVLLVDMDPKGSASTLLAHSTNLQRRMDLFEGFQNGSLKECIVEVTDNLHIISSQPSLNNFSEFLRTHVKVDVAQVSYLKKLLEPIRGDYDYIFIDVPPTISDFLDNAVMAADYALVILQAQELSLEGAEMYLHYLQFMVNTYDASIQVAGILPVLLRPGGRIDFSTLEQAKDMFGEDNVMENVVKHLERLKAWDVTGITNNDMHDKKAHQVFLDVVAELEQKLAQFEEAGKYE